MRRLAALLAAQVLSAASVMAWLLAAAALGSRPARAQTADSTRSTAPTRGLMHAALPIGLALAGAAGAMPFDAAVSRGLQSHAVQTSGLGGGVRAIDVAGGLGMPVLTVGLFAAGHLTHHPALADAGLHATEALAGASLVAVTLKFVVGRARPVTAQWADPGERGPDSDEFRPIRGTSGWASFPSGHTTAAFAVASALSAELSVHGARATRVVRPLLFAGAAAVGLARMYANEHWASDVIAGAVIGTVIGSRAVSRAHGRATPADRALPGFAITRAGPALLWSIPLR